ncbi:MAG: Nramp family divalent metal transporter [Candidatus Pacebacteria bacterium]|nr:Nramp family divalent metal transporter [Candidatus Paceibacterota bacterium]MBP9866463.1 Nramp family divalent metal transporter [Candidatus Paceibacterota bacterium]
MFTKFKEYWNKIGPGLVTGAADDDPSGIATYSQAGAQYGFSFLWTSLFTFPFMAVVQEMCARLGIVTGKGLASAIRTYCPPYVLYTATIFLMIANTFNIGADISAVGEAVQLLFPHISAIAIVLAFTFTSLMLQVFIPYQKYSKYLKYLSFVLIAYILAGLSIDFVWRDLIVSTLIPHFTFDKNSVLLICAILGTSISPYLFFWQTSQEVEENIAQRKGDHFVGSEISVVDTKHAIKDMRFDVWTGMFFSNITMFFIIAVCGAVLFPNGVTNIETASQAAEALLPFAGRFTYLLFALGIIGTGLLAVPILAGSTAYAISETFKFKEGLYRKYTEAKAFYGIIAISMFVGLLITFVGIPPMKALFYSAVLNGIIAPPLLFIIVYLSSKEIIMKEWKNTKLQSFLGWVITIIMALASSMTLFYIFV